MNDGQHNDAFFRSVIDTGIIICQISADKRTAATTKPLGDDPERLIAHWTEPPASKVDSFTILTHSLPCTNKFCYYARSLPPTPNHLSPLIFSRNDFTSPTTTFLRYLSHYISTPFFATTSKTLLVRLATHSYCKIYKGCFSNVIRLKLMHISFAFKEIWWLNFTADTRDGEFYQNFSRIFSMGSRILFERRFFFFLFFSNNNIMYPWPASIDCSSKKKELSVDVNNNICI